MVTDEIYELYIDEEYRDFASRLSLTDRMPRLGIRIPVLRKLSKTVKSDEIEIRYHEDVILKGLAIGVENKPFEEKEADIVELLPYLSSWDQTDIIATAFKYNKTDWDEEHRFFFSLLNEEEVYSKRLGIVWILQNRKHLNAESTIRTLAKCDDENEYYISMAIAWAFSFFYLDNPENKSYMKEASAITRKRTKQKIRDSRRYKGEFLDL